MSSYVTIDLLWYAMARHGVARDGISSVLRPNLRKKCKKTIILQAFIAMLSNKRVGTVPTNTEVFLRG